MALKRKNITPQQALVRLETLCAASEQCTHDLLNKMLRWGLQRDAADEVLDSLIDRRFVDDSRFAAAYARDKMRFSRWGRRKIAAALYARRISRSDIADALAGLPDEEYRLTCTRLLKSKVRSARLKQTPEDVRKLYAFGVARGFESALVSSLVRSGLPFSEE